MADQELIFEVGEIVGVGSLKGVPATVQSITATLCTIQYIESKDIEEVEGDFTLDDED